MHIRRASPDEASTLSALALRAKAFWGYSSAQLEAWKPDVMISAADIVTTETFVVESETELLGFCSLRRMPHTMVLEHFWVDPTHMHKGHGRALMRHCTEIAVLAGASFIEIDSDPNAEAFYLTLGAKRVGVVLAPIEGNPGRIRPQLSLVTPQPEPHGPAEAAP